jgi:hypothetical protein
MVRDPRDVMVSFFHYKKHRQKSYRGDFADFIRHPNFGLESWFRHYTSWLPHWTLVVRYEDMKENTYTEFSRILQMFNVTVSAEIVHRAIERSSIQNVRAIETSPDDPKSREQHFTRNGRTQQWCTYFSEVDLSYYDALAEEYDFELY